MADRTTPEKLKKEGGEGDEQKFKKLINDIVEKGRVSIIRSERGAHDEDIIQLMDDVNNDKLMQALKDADFSGQHTWYVEERLELF